MKKDELDQKKLIVLDLDGTLTDSKAPIEADMAKLLAGLIKLKKVAIISGAGYPQFEDLLLKHLPADQVNFDNLYLLPTSGTKMYAWRGSWFLEYSEELTRREKERIIEALTHALKDCNFEKPAETFGHLVEDRGSQITFSALGQNAPAGLKFAWDPTREKRQKLADKIHELLPDYDARVGGASSVDITRRGVNKGYGIRKLETYLRLRPEELLFVGDALFFGGNDYPVKAAGIDCIHVKGPVETRMLIRSWTELD